MTMAEHNPRTTEDGKEVNEDMFTIVDRPQEVRRGRKPLYNPFVGNLPKEGKAGQFAAQADSVELRRAIRQIRAAAHEEGKSARIMISDPVKGRQTVTFWTTERVARSKDDKDGE